MFEKIPCICIPLVSNDKLHPSETTILALYLYFEDGTFNLVNFSHPDKPISDIQLNDVKLHPKSLVFNKKLLAYNGFDSGVDLNSYMQYYVDDTINVSEFYPKTFEYFYSKFYKDNSVGKIIPISKHIEFAENIILFVMSYYKSDRITESCISYSDDFVQVFRNIEQTPIMVDGVPHKQNYMWYTSTTRPSNSWNNFNFSAINKKDGSRSKITSKFNGGKLIQFDYDAFHVKLLAKILQYNFTKHPYEEIKEELGLEISYKEFKSLVFKNIYGNITDKFLQHPFFLRVQAMIDELYNEYTTNGFIESYFYKKRFRDIEDESPNKIFNYFLQSLETEYNVHKMKLISELLNEKKSTLSMYVYDAFIFDIHPDELDIIPVLTKVFETDDMTIKLSIGDDLNDIKEI
jgi:hypothetical protein